MEQAIRVALCKLLILNFILTWVAATIFDGREFDFIIVGGGTAGLAVAGRLAESGKFTVLVIQERGLPDSYLNVPAINIIKVREKRDLCIDKVYQSVPQQFANLVHGGVMQYPISAVLGGCSQHNEMFFNRGSPHDYNNWANITRDLSWRYENMLHYFRKLESYKGHLPNSQRGFTGPITVSRPNYAPDFPHWFKAAEELGFRTADPNSPQMESFSFVEFSKERGRRVSSFAGYLAPKLKSHQASLHNPLDTQPAPPLLTESFRDGHLSVLIHTTAKRIVFNGDRAIGVKYVSSECDSVAGTVFARMEIILSAGVMDSPAILMRSGIGPEDVLREAGIRPVKHLPVGIGLQDHPYLFLPFIYGNQSVLFSPSRDLTPENWKVYEETGDGPFSASLTGGGQAFVVAPSSSQEEKQLGWPNLFLYLTSMNVTDPKNPQQSDLKEWETPVTWLACVGRPKSRGFVRLNASDVEGQPIIDMQLLTQEQDNRALLDGVKFLRRICEDTRAFRGIGCRLPSTPHPSCAQYPYPSDSYWQCLITMTTLAGLHGVGTCRMGIGPEAVVTPELKVIGIKGLRVVDGSVMPVVPNANLQAPIYAIAEKAVDMILREWGAI